MRRAGLPFLVSFCVVIIGCNPAVPPSAPDAMLLDPAVATAPAGPRVTGRWTGVGHRASGSVRDSVENGVGRLEFSEDFTVSAVPGPFVLPATP